MTHTYIFIPISSCSYVWPTYCFVILYISKKKILFEEKYLYDLYFQCPARGSKSTDCSGP